VRRAADAESVRLANDSEIGLSRRLHPDLTRALQAEVNVDVGVLHVNSESAGADPHVPIGGAKNSGLGPRSRGWRGLRFFTPHHHGYLRGRAPRG
jgi:aldehyde dehydrogenase (NAD+)